MNAAVIAAVLALVFSLGGAASYKVTSMHFEGVIAEHKALDEADRETARLKAHAAEAQYEAFRATQRPIVAATREKVVHEIQIAGGCAVQPLPDGLRNALNAAIEQSNQSVPHPAVSAVPAPSAGDLR